MTHPKWHLPPDRCFDPDTAQRRVARELYESVADLPFICPHGHVDPSLFADENVTFGSPMDSDNAHEMIHDLTYRLAKRAYRFR